MKLEENKVYKMKWEEGAYLLPPKCANLIIADPPYFEVKGEFDFVWKSFEDYLKDVEKWAKACKHVLADNGSLFVYGHAKKIAYVQVVFDKLFTLENHLKWEKTDCYTRKSSYIQRSFAPVTEHILFYSNGNLFGNYLSSEIEKSKYNYNDIDVFLGYVRSKNKNRGTELCRRWCEGSSIPKKEDYEKIKKLLDLEKEYYQLDRVFKASNFTDVLKFSQQVNVTGKFDHPTKKPPKLTRALIFTCSKKSDLVVIPFAGSGTECAMAAKEGRRFIGFDIEQKYVDMGNKRAAQYLENRQTSILDFVDY